MDKTLFKFKVESAKRKIKSGAEKVLAVGAAGLEYAEEHKEFVLPLAMGGVALVKKGATIHAESKNEKKRYERLYDPRRGKYIELKRKPTRREDEEIERRYDNGESYRSIINDMGLAK